jgi:hypothetical protein
MRKPKRSSVRNQKISFYRETLSIDEGTSFEVKTIKTLAKDVWAEVRFVGTPSAGASEDFIDGQITGKIKLEIFCSYIPGIKFEDFCVFKGGRYDIYSIQVTGNKVGLVIRAELRDDNTYGEILNPHKDIDAFFEKNHGVVAAPTHPADGAVYHRLAFPENVFSFEPLTLSTFRNSSSVAAANFTVKCVEYPFLNEQIAAAFGTAPANPKNYFYTHNNSVSPSQTRPPDWDTNIIATTYLQNFNFFVALPQLKEPYVNNVFVPKFSDAIELQHNPDYLLLEKPIFHKVFARGVFPDNYADFVSEEVYDGIIQGAVRYEVGNEKSCIQISRYAAYMNGKFFPKMSFCANLSFAEQNSSKRIPYGETNGVLKLIVTPFDYDEDWSDTTKVAKIKALDGIVQKLHISNYEYANFVPSNEIYCNYYPVSDPIFYPVPQTRTSVVQVGNPPVAQFDFWDVENGHTDPKTRVSELSVFKPDVNWHIEDEGLETEYISKFDLDLNLDGEVLDKIVFMYDQSDINLSHDLNGTDPSVVIAYPHLFPKPPSLGVKYGTVSGYFSDDVPNIYPKDLKTDLLEAFVGYKVLLGYTEWQPTEEQPEPPAEWESEPILSEEKTYDIKKYVSGRDDLLSYSFENIPPPPEDYFGEFVVYFKLKTDLIDDRATEKHNLPHTCMLKVTSPELNG